MQNYEFLTKFAAMLRSSYVILKFLEKRLYTFFEGELR